MVARLFQSVVFCLVLAVVTLGCGESFSSAVDGPPASLDLGPGADGPRVDAPAPRDGSPPKRDAPAPRVDGPTRRDTTTPRADSAPPRVDAAPRADLGPVTPSCDPYSVRSPAPEVLIGPVGLETKLLQRIQLAQKQILVMIYQFTRYNFSNALIAAHKRGVQVKVLLDGKQGANSSVRSKLTAAGIAVKSAPTSFTHAHAKVIWIDGYEAIVMSANLITYSMGGERNYGVIDRDPYDLKQLKQLFDRDWAGTGTVDLSCSRLVVSPINARARMLAHVNRAKKTLDFAVMYLDDKTIKTAVLAQAKAGVAVRVLLANPAWITSNTARAAELKAAGVPVKYFKNYDLHAKLMISDGIPFVGSQNFSYTSIQKNREIGVFVNASTRSQIVAQFAADWKLGVAP